MVVLASVVVASASLVMIVGASIVAVFGASKVVVVGLARVKTIIFQIINWTLCYCSMDYQIMKNSN